MFIFSQDIWRKENNPFKIKPPQLPAVRSNDGIPSGDKSSNPISIDKIDKSVYMPLKHNSPVVQISLRKFLMTDN